MDALRNLREILRLAAAIDRNLLIWYYLSAAIGAVAPIATGLFAKFLMDSLVSAQDLSVHTVPLAITAVLVGYYVIGIGGDVVQWSLNQTYLDHLLRYKLQNGLSLRFSRKLTELDIAHLEDPHVRDLISVTNDTFRWRIPDYMRIIANAFGRFVSYLAAAIALAPIDPVLPIALTLAVLPRVYYRARQGALQWSFYGSGAPRTRELGYYGSLFSGNSSLREMKVFRSQETILQRYRDSQNAIYELTRQPLDRYLKPAILSPVIEGGVLLSLVWWRLPDVLAGTMSIGTFMFITGIGSTVLIGAAAAATYAGEAYENNLYVRQFISVMALPRLIREAPEPVRLSTGRPPRIEFRNVTFAYPRNDPVLHDVSFVVEPGESLAFVGANGSGKSTIIKLLCRFYDVSHGEILIDGVNLKLVSLADWYAQIGTLFQDFVHYHFSVRDNILMGDTARPDPELLRSAARRADAERFIDQLPDGFDQQLGREFENGRELSGGQWQKLAIARAFHRSAPILIMDEPTSSIDAASEFEIFSNLEREYVGKTLILVSHRFSTVRNANKIIVLDGGRVLEEGTHAQLMELDGQYAKMFRSQAQGYR